MTGAPGRRSPRALASATGGGPSGAWPSRRPSKPSPAPRQSRCSSSARSWQREPGGAWEPTSGDGLWGRVLSYLPPTDPPDLASEDRGGVTVPRWYDADGDAAVTLEVDPASSAPRRLRRVVRATGTVVTVVYRDWDAPVVIEPSDAR